MQLDLFSTAFPFPQGSWIRPSHCGKYLVLFISDPLFASQHMLARKLLDHGLIYISAQLLDGGLAVCFSCPNWMKRTLFNSLPKPVSRGSRTHGNLLPF